MLVILITLRSPILVNDDIMRGKIYVNQNGQKETYKKNQKILANTLSMK